MWLVRKTLLILPGVVGLSHAVYKWTCTIALRINIAEIVVRSEVGAKGIRTWTFPNVLELLGLEELSPPDVFEPRVVLARNVHLTLLESPLGYASVRIEPHDDWYTFVPCALTLEHALLHIHRGPVHLFLH
jgi:hypothetical protein